MSWLDSPFESVGRMAFPVLWLKLKVVPVSVLGIGPNYEVEVLLSVLIMALWALPWSIELYTPARNHVPKIFLKHSFM